MVVVASVKELPADLAALFDKFGYGLVEKVPPGEHLLFVNDRLSYRAGEKEPQVFVDYSVELANLTRQRRGAKKDLLCRALGLDKHPNSRVIDGTLGLGRDACHLLHFGAQINGIEQDPLTWLLVYDGRRRMPQDFVNNFHIYQMETESYLAESILGDEVLYLDPMFEDTQKKSLPKKGMVFLRSRQNSEPAIGKIVEIAMAKGLKRIVVKRPIKGDHLYGVPSYTIKGNLVRYDVYLGGDI